jgi:molecular chaperone DnaK (HSP70)
MDKQSDQGSNSVVDLGSSTLHKSIISFRSECNDEEIVLEGLEDHLHTYAPDFREVTMDQRVICCLARAPSAMDVDRLLNTIHCVTC